MFKVLAEKEHIPLCHAAKWAPANGGREKVRYKTAKNMRGVKKSGQSLFYCPCGETKTLFSVHSHILSIRSGLIRLDMVQKTKGEHKGGHGTKQNEKAMNIDVLLVDPGPMTREHEGCEPAPGK